MNWGTKLVVAGMVAVLLLPKTTLATDTGDPCGSTAGSASLSIPDIRCGNQPNLAEAYAPSSYAMYSNYGADLTSIAQHGAWNGAGTFFFELSAQIGEATLTVIEWAFTVDLVSVMGGAGKSIAQALHDWIYVPCLLLAALVLAAYLLRAMIKHQHGEIWSHVLRALLAMVVSGVFMQNPLWLPMTLNNLSREISLTGMGAIARVDPQLNAQASSDQYRRGLDAHPEYAGLRYFADGYMRAFVYDPWAVATFQSTKTARSCFSGQLDGGLIGAASGVFDGLTGSTWDKAPHVIDSNCSTLADATLTVNSKGTTSQPLEDQEDQVGHNVTYFKGNMPEGRGMMGILTLVTVMISALMLGGLAVTAIIGQFSLEILTALAPLVFLAAVTPYGQRLLLKWAQLLFAFAGISAISALLTAILLVFCGSLSSAIGDTSWWWLTSIMELILIASAWFLRRPLLHMAGSQTGIDHHAFHVTQLGRARQHAPAGGSFQVTGMPAKGGVPSGTKSLIARGRPVASAVTSKAARLAASKVGGTAGIKAVAAGTAAGGLPGVLIGASLVAKKGLSAARKVREVHSKIEGVTWKMVDGHLTEEFRPVAASPSRSNGNGHGKLRLDKTAPVIPSRPAGNGNGHKSAPPRAESPRSVAPRKAASGGVELVRPDGTPVNGGLKVKAEQQRQLIVPAPSIRAPRGDRG